MKIVKRACSFIRYLRVTGVKRGGRGVKKLKIGVTSFIDGPLEVTGVHYRDFTFKFTAQSETNAKIKRLYPFAYY